MLLTVITCVTMRSDERSSSETTAGKFGYIATVGRGGMADVYLVSSSGPAGFAKLLVVKELRAELANSDEFVEMFLNEARLAARLHHPSIVQTYDVTRQGTRFFLVMEHLDGQPLHRVLTRLEAEPDTMQRVYLHAIMAGLDGLHYAHDLCDYDGRALELVHRDVSPHNLSVLYSGHVKLVDFGIAKAALGVSTTRAGIVKGKAAYMAPEQALARPTDRRADIYSCGVMLWEALARRRIWAGMDEVSIIGRLMQGEVPSLREAVPDCPAPLSAVCERALAVDPEERYATADEMRVALAAAMNAVGIHPSRHETAEVTKRAFEQERARMARAIEHHMNSRDDREHFSDLADLANRAGREFEGPRSQRDDDTVPEIRSELTEVVAPPASVMRHKRRWTPTTAIVATVLLATCVIVVGQFRGRASQSQTLSSKVGAVAAPSASASDCGAANKPVVELTGEIEDDATLSCAQDYVLRFNVLVTPGATLTIEKGTTILGGGRPHAALVVQRGARIIAEGTPEEPIVFTSAKPPDQRSPGDWGGVVILGNAPVNLMEEQSGQRRGRVEGLTFGGEYGGEDVDDDSGVLRYVRIEYAGYELAPGNELNGLTLAGVGRGTQIDHVQVRQTTDDCFEFFGGTVDAKYLICQATGDDAFDWDYGYRGRLQFLLFQSTLNSLQGGNGLEGDNDPNGSSNEPRSAPKVCNATLCGDGTLGGKEDYGVMVRRGTDLELVNSVVTGFDAGFDMRDRGTEIDIRGSVFGGNSAHDVAYAETLGGVGNLRDDDHGVDELRLFLESGTNRAESPNLVDCHDPKQPNFAPREPLTTNAQTAPDDGFFESAPYVGAVRDEHDDWYLAPWVRWSDH